MMQEIIPETWKRPHASGIFNATTTHSKAVAPKNFHGWSNNCLMGLIYTFFNLWYRWTFPRWTFGPSHWKCLTSDDFHEHCKSIFFQDSSAIPPAYLSHITVLLLYTISGNGNDLTFSHQQLPQTSWQLHFPDCHKLIQLTLNERILAGIEHQKRKVPRPML